MCDMYYWFQSLELYWGSHALPKYAFASPCLLFLRWVNVLIHPHLHHFAGFTAFFPRGNLKARGKKQTIHRKSISDAILDNVITETKMDRGSRHARPLQKLSLVNQIQHTPQNGTCFNTTRLLTYNLFTLNGFGGLHIFCQLSFKLCWVCC